MRAAKNILLVEDSPPDAGLHDLTTISFMAERGRQDKAFRSVGFSTYRGTNGR